MSRREELRAACMALAALVVCPTSAVAQGLAWARQIGTVGLESVYAAALDGAGGVYVGGWTTGSLGGASAGSFDTWIARFDTAGSQLWVRQLGTNKGEDLRTLAPDGQGGVFAGGVLDSPLSRLQVARFDRAGEQLWIQHIGSGPNTLLGASAADTAGGVYVSGTTVDNFGGPPLGLSDCWVAHYQGSGTQTWVRRFGTSSHDGIAAAAPDGQGGVYLAGGTNLGGSLDDILVARYDNLGNQLWMRKFGSAIGAEVAWAAASDGTGGIYLGGYTYGNLGGPNAGGEDAWLARLDGGGNLLWTRQPGTVDDDWFRAAAPDGEGGVYFGGYTRVPVCGPGIGYSDVWLVRYDGAGNEVWCSQTGTARYEAPWALVSDGAGGLYVGGATNGNLGGPNVGGLDAWVARHPRYLPAQPVIYCTAKTNSLGCVPLIVASGFPSTKASAGFLVTARNVRNHQPGLLLYTLAGRTLKPFQGGVLCLAAPIRRASVEDSGGSLPPVVDCSGVWEIDMNAFGSGKTGGNPDPALRPGSFVHCQWWGRDPGAAFGSALTEAVQYQIAIE